jgi:hypothetical protein
MEPIDLNGKVFCSNCGMTIKESRTETGDLPIVKSGQTEIQNESVDEKAMSAGQTVTEDKETKGAEEAPKPAKTVEEPEVFPRLITGETKTNSADEGNLVRDELMKTMNRPTADKTETEEMKVASNIPSQPAKIPVKNLDNSKVAVETILGDQTNLKASDLKPTQTFDERVKDIDTLGASGVLMDILDDKALEKQQEQKVESLEAAEELVDDIDTSKQKPDKAEVNINDARIIKPAVSKKPVMTPAEIEASLTSKPLPLVEDKPSEMPRPSQFKPTEKDKTSAMIETTAEDLQKGQVYNSRVNNQPDVLGGPSPVEEGTETRHSAVKRYFSNIFGKKTDAK